MEDSGSIIRYRSETPILAADKPWEEGASLRAISVMPDGEEGRVRLYYLVWNREDSSKNALCVAYTQDGFHWEKPDLGEGHNVVMRGSGCKLDWGVYFPYQVIHDPADEDANLRWKMAYWDRPRDSSPYGICLAGSRDGFSWQPLSDYPAITAGNDGCCLTAVNEPGPCPWLKAKYHIYQQTWKYNPDLPTERDNLKNMHRRISLWTVQEFTWKWTGPILILEPDEHDPPDLQFYWLTTFHMKDGFGGFVACHHTIDQTMDLQFVTSKDGWTWERRNDRQPILPVGGPGRFDCGSVFSISGPMRIRDKVFILYGGRAKLHDQQLRYPELECPQPEAGIGLAEIDPAILDIP